MVDDASEPYELTARQMQILQLAAEDLPAKQIARELCISVRTVEWHFAAMRSRTGCVTVGGLTAWAVASGIVAAPRTPRPGYAGNAPAISGHPLAGSHPPRGRPRLMTAEKIAEASRLFGTVPLTRLARHIGVSRGTLYTHMPAIKAAKAATTTKAIETIKTAAGG